MVIINSSDPDAAIERCVLRAVTHTAGAWVFVPRGTPSIPRYIPLAALPTEFGGPVEIDLEALKR